MPIAVIAFDFDPLLRLTDDLVLRWQTLALAVVIAACLVVSGVMTRRYGLRADDLLYIAIGAVPGAVILARLGYGLAHLDVFGTDPGRLLDPSVGGLDLALGVVGGILAGTYVASLLGASVGAWAHLAALGLLVAIGAGKLTMVLGGSGQGLPSDAPWATAFLGAGPWASLAPALPSDPSQIYEGVATLAWAALLAIVAGLVRVPPDGRLLLLAVGGWAALRTAVSLSWRDPAVIAGLSAAGLLSLAVAIGALVLLLGLLAKARRARGAAASDIAGGGDGVPSWPDPDPSGRS